MRARNINLVLCEPYIEVLHDKDMDEIVGEVNLWKQRVTVKHFSSAIEALDECSEIAFPNVFQLISNLVVLLVTTCTNEKAFSTGRRLKTYVCSTMSETD